MRARIINKNYHVSKVVSEYSVNNRIHKHVEYLVNKKDTKSLSNRADRVVFRAMHLAGSNVWEKVYNQLDGNCTDHVMESLQSSLDKHTV